MALLQKKENPVIIRLFCNNCELHFSVDNKIDPAKSQYSSMGMGLKNLEKRLALEYKDLALLNCENKNGIFQASLKIVQQATPKE